MSHPLSRIRRLGLATDFVRAVAVGFAACVSAIVPSVAHAEKPAALLRVAGAADAKAAPVAETDVGAVAAAVGPDGKAPAVKFDGRGAHRTAVLPADFRLGTGDFTVALWVNTAETLDDDLGDLVTWYDATKRVGFNLSLRNNTGVTTCQSNNRQLQFGIDAGSEPKWTDEGRPGNATIAFGLAVHDGKLFAATAASGPNDFGRVYRYDGTGKWTNCGAPDESNAVVAMATHEGKLYVGTGKYRFGGSALGESENKTLGGRIFRYDGDNLLNIWREVGQLPETEAVGGLVVYKGRLYASSLYKPAGFFRYEKDGEWTSLPAPEAPEKKRVECLGVYNGYLWATSYDGGKVYRYDGESWKDYGVVGENTQTYAFAIHRGKLNVATWPSGRVFRLGSNDAWEDTGRLGEELEVMGMLVHNGQFYAGTLPLAQVHRYDGDGAWTMLAQLDTTPDVKYRRAWTMAQHDGRLFCSTLPSGKVHSLTAGPCVTYDRELAAGWRHVAAVKSGGRLRLYVDGKRVAESAEFDASKFNLTTSQPLRIGAGEGDFFHGTLSYDMLLRKSALTDAQISDLAAKR